MNSDINKKAISALGTIADANVGLSTKVPVQRPNQIPFEQVTLNQIKRSIIAECTTDAATANKTATVTNFADFELIPGLDILVYFKAANTANNITLSINDSNAYPIKALGTAEQLGNGSIKAGAYKKLTFTGDSFITEAPTISVMNSESDLPLNSAAVSTELSTNYYNKQSVDGALANYAKNTDFNRAGNQILVDYVGDSDVTKTTNYKISNFSLILIKLEGGIIPNYRTSTIVITRGIFENRNTDQNCICASVFSDQNTYCSCYINYVDDNHISIRGIIKKTWTYFNATIIGLV